MLLLLRFGWKYSNQTRTYPFLNLEMTITGPKDSSWAIYIWSSTSVNTVGSMKKPKERIEHGFEHGKSAQGFAVVQAISVPWFEVMNNLQLETANSYEWSMNGNACTSREIADKRVKEQPVHQWQHVLFPARLGGLHAAAQVTSWGKTLLSDSRKTRLHQVTEATVFLAYPTRRWIVRSK